MRALELDVAGAGRWAAHRSAAAVRRGGISNSMPANTALASVVVAVLAMSGWALAEGHLKPIFLGAAAAGVCALAFAQRGAFIGIFLLLAMNGVPEIDTSTHLVSHFTGQDFAIFMLLLASGAWALLGTNPNRPTAGGRVLISAGTLLLTWCLFTVMPNGGRRECPGSNGRGVRSRLSLFRGASDRATSIAPHASRHQCVAGNPHRRCVPLCNRADSDGSIAWVPGRPHTCQLRLSS